MSNKATSFLKQLITTIVTAIKTKSMMMKTKTNSLKTRLAIFNLLRNKKLISSAINHKIHAIMGHDKNTDEISLKQQQRDYSKALVLYKGDKKTETREGDDYYIDMSSPSFNESFIYEEGDGGDNIQDEEIVNGNESVIDMVKESKEGEGEEFSLEAEIDHVADMFIKRFHRQMKLQKLESFKRYQEMIQRGT